ncbi:hypothetical protein DXG03_001598 [Asterophora parasitica]|uniref:Adenine DNA glycosylase n=1 Tax=Asterophora parasitica TaxID=117018 RepID=A0A9P7G5A8_9AGAR|nr:hypothetical protein DXG03_001598 [Asterophora parasitica]
MPWRKPYDPLLSLAERAQRAYEVWVSEIMLQQTQVATVVPYYTRWMEKFPTIHELATANIEEVNALWKGLGYYSRASRLLAGAQKAVAEYNGMLPDNAKEMEACIPGIGRYSAGAICSIAYEPIKAPAAPIAETDTSADSTLSCPEVTQYPGDINQALIELGSTVCKVRDPTCKTCPIRPWCKAYEIAEFGRKPITDIEDVCALCEPPPETGVTGYPMKVARKKPREELDIVNVVEWHSAAKPQERWFLMVRRPEGGLLAGLYEFPTSGNVARTTSRAAQVKMPHALVSELVVPSMSIAPYDAKNRRKPSHDVIEIASIQPVRDVVHIFSHIKKTYRPQWVVLQGGGDAPPALKSARGNPSTSDSIDEGLSSTSLRPILNNMWIQLKEVPNVNMGTGVVKVWNSTKELWEGGVGGS